MTILLDIDPRAAAERAGELDRFEAEGAELQEKVAEAYRTLARAEPRRWVVIDAARGEHEVHQNVAAVVREPSPR